MHEEQSVFDDERKYYWSPSVRWQRRDSEVRIEIFSYPEAMANLFPEFYFVTQRGIVPRDLLGAFSAFDERDLRDFITDLVRKRVLVSSLLTPPELFFPASVISRHEQDRRLMYDAEESERFKARQLDRGCPTKSETKVILRNNDEYPPVIADRISYRRFDTETPIAFASVSRLLSILRQRKSDDGIRYYYASAGGLYPFDIYACVKEGRVSDLQNGLYYFSPVDNSLNLIDSNCDITKEAHYLPNQAIFQQSAISVYLVFNAAATMPKYGGMGYFYACIDAGLIVGALTFAAELCNIGVCSIGDMKFKKIEKYFRLNRDQVYIHSVECGLKASNGCSAESGSEQA